ncbi:hypothetical protein IWQ60_003681 [Tieghemiomyces parasiticus]|uniref:DUF1764-domain-containing protein n=1 Tax=Tieghemiomyces parasiticus TaxID=78921 RepID=A0A9W8DZU1_9FUNG|nr:hypothetical protein IWQ60_003681 [Tieghemiomyces parasiticus]
MGQKQVAKWGEKPSATKTKVPTIKATKAITVPPQPAEAKKAKSTPSDATEIDDIFACKPKRTAIDDGGAANSGDKSGRKRSADADSPAEPAKRQQAAVPPPDDDGFFDTRGRRSKRQTEDGLPLFSLDDLKIGQGQDTPDCPFDCECCY